MKKNTLRRLIKFAVQPLFQPWVPFKVRRVLMGGTALLQHKQAGVLRSQEVLAGEGNAQVHAYCAQPAEPGPLHILYLHGGGYVFGGKTTHRQVVDGLALIGKATVWLPEYRLAPEHPFPAAIEDAIVSYCALLQRGINPNNIMLAGDSAGGGLTMALALQIRDLKLPAPNRLVVFSPWVDLTVTRPSHFGNAKLDPMLVPAGLTSCAQAYCATTPANHPLCSPLFANLNGLPPLLIQVGSDEILYDDAIQLQQAVIAAGGEASLQVFAGMWHVFQLHSHQLPEATEALQACFDIN